MCWGKEWDALLKNLYHIQQISHWRFLESWFFFLPPAPSCALLPLVFLPGCSRRALLAQGFKAELAQGWKGFSSESGRTLLMQLSPFPLSGEHPEQLDFSRRGCMELFVYWSSVRRQTQPLLFSGSDLFLWLPGDHCFLFPLEYKIKLPVLLHPSSTLWCSPFLFLSPDYALMHFTFCKSSSFSFYLIF